MPVKLGTSTAEATQNIIRLESKLNETQAADVKIQYFIAELVMIRLFSIVEENIALTAYKIVCGATYLNGASPRLLVPRSRSIDHARLQMQNHNRSRPINLCWGKLKDIKTATQYTIDANDFFIQQLSNYGLLISDMRKVRNYVAHNNNSSRIKYKEVIRSTYGADLKLPVGAFLLSRKRNQIANLSRYLTSSKILINDIAKGF